MPPAQGISSASPQLLLSLTYVWYSSNGPACPILPRSIAWGRIPLSVKHHLPYQPQPSSSFFLCFITGNISTCVGYRKSTWRLVWHRMTWASKRKNCNSSYISLSSTTTQSMFGYVHCHCKLQCVHMRQLPSKQESIKYHQRWQKHCHMTRNSTCKLQLRLP